MYLGNEGGPQPRDYAEATQRVIDEEVSRLLKEADQHAQELLRGHRDVLDAVTELLIEREILDGEEVYRLAGRQMPSSAPVGIAERAAATGTSGLSGGPAEAVAEPPTR